MVASVGRGIVGAAPEPIKAPLPARRWFPEPMASLLFAAPGIERFHLLERLARLLQSRGHHVTVLATGAAGVFWRAQALPVWVAEPGSGPACATTPDLDLAPFAEIDVRLAGARVPAASAVARATRPLARVLPALARMVETEPPDLVYCH